MKKSRFSQEQIIAVTKKHWPGLQWRILDHGFAGFVVQGVDVLILTTELNDRSDAETAALDIPAGAESHQQGRLDSLDDSSRRQRVSHLLQRVVRVAGAPATGQQRSSSSS